MLARNLERPRPLKSARLPSVSGSLSTLIDTSFDQDTHTSGSGPPLDNCRIWDQLIVCSHNINRIKNHPNKLLNFTEWATERHVTIAGLSETNIDKRDGHFCLPPDSRYTGF